MSKNNRKAVADNMADALTKALELHKKLDPRQLENINFEYRREGDNYTVYLVSSTHEIKCIEVPDERLAVSAVRAMRTILDNKPVKVSEVPKMGKVSSQMVKKLQARVMAIDPARRVRFKESLVAINYLIHMLVDEIDTNTELFDALLDNNEKQRIRTINKQLDRLLDDIYKSGVMGDMEDFTDCAKAGYAFVERFEMIVNYIAAEEWRFMEFDKKLADLLPDVYVNDKREQYSKYILEVLTKNAQPDELPKKRKF